MSALRARLVAGLVSLAVAVPASAHGFGRTYSLPVPFWLYSYAAIATLLLTFALAVVSLRRPLPAQRPTPPQRAVPGVLAGIPAILLLGVAVACGFFGVRNPFANLSMSLFWVGFVLVVAYLSALLGDLNATCNPFHALSRLLAAGVPPLRRGLLRYPAWLASWPALLLYMAFVHVELFGHQHPRGLAWLLLAYAGITLAGSLLFGAASWLRHGECFGVLLRLLALMAPRLWRDAEGRWRLRLPFSGLLDARCGHFSELVFLLFLLTSTSFDGLHQSAPWVKLYWSDLMHLVAPWVTPPLLGHYETLARVYGWWQQFWLFAMPFLYGAAYLLCMAWMRRLTGTSLSVRELSLRFALTLLPIILVYHLGHYLSLLVTQGTQLIPLASDPLGRGWNLFGTATWVSPAIVLEPATLWHSQVLLIVAGHGVGVWLAHVEALRLFGTPRLAMRSQWPLLLLMLFLTVAGLWILAQPYSPPNALQSLQAI